MKCSKKRYQKIQNWGKRIIFIAGFLLCIFPIISNVITRGRQEEAIATYQTAVDDKVKSNLEEILNDAEKYNELLFQFQGAVVNQVDLYEDDYYSEQLDCSGTGIMGSLEIPKIDVNLPIYHGTGEESLSNGIGHIKGTSLPVGGSNTHAVLSGHRGLPSSKLLIRMDEIEKGDYFFIKTCNQTLAYEVTLIQVVEPEDVSSLQIEPGEDKISLVTCTPYGINTHRLIVTGIRRAYEASHYENIQEAWPSFREMMFTVLPFILALVMIIMNCMDRRNVKHAKNKKDTSDRKCSSDDICTNSISTRRNRRSIGKERYHKKRKRSNHSARQRK